MSAILLSLLVYDFWEIFLKGSRAKLRDDAIQFDWKGIDPPPQAEESYSKIKIHPLDNTENTLQNPGPSQNSSKSVTVKNKLASEPQLLDEQMTINKLR